MVGGVGTACATMAAAVTGGPVAAVSVAVAGAHATTAAMTYVAIATLPV